MSVVMHRCCWTDLSSPSHKLKKEEIPKSKSFKWYSAQPASGTEHHRIKSQGCIFFLNILLAASYMPAASETTQLNSIIQIAGEHQSK